MLASPKCTMPKGVLAPRINLENGAALLQCMHNPAQIHRLPSLKLFSVGEGLRCHAAAKREPISQLQIVMTYPEPETEKERSPIDFPQVS